MTYGANDVGGIFGKVQMENKDDAMTINIAECVNGSNVKLDGSNMSAGIFAYIGPYNLIPHVEVNIDRCRNYCYDLGGTITSGIFGNRGNPRSTQAGMKKTTITNCFSLVNKYRSYDRAIAYGGNTNSLDGYNNYYMDKYSFWDTSEGWGAQGMTQLGRSDPPSITDVTGRTSDRGDGENKLVHARRLWAGKDNDANAANDVLKDEDGNVVSSNSHVYFAARLRTNTDTDMGYNVNTSAINKNNIKIRLESEANGHWYDPASKRLLTTKNYGDGDGDQSWNYAGEILLLFDESGDNSYATMADITDEALQNYYSYLLDTSRPSAPQNLKVTKSDDTENAYGRYTLTWISPPPASLPIIRCVFTLSTRTAPRAIPSSIGPASTKSALPLRGGGLDRQLQCGSQGCQLQGRRRFRPSGPRRKLLQDPANPRAGSAPCQER